MQVGLTTVNGAMHDNTSIWRMPPSREVDAAWDSLTRGGLEIITVSAADIELSGKDPALSVKVPPSWNQGPDAYFAQIEIFHILHCLDGIRKEMWSEYYYDDPSDAIRRELKAHCLHVILQNLLCTADVGIVQYNWMHDDRYPESRTIPVPDYNLVKQCRNFDALLEWTIDRSVPGWQSKWRELQVPEDAVVFPGDIIL